MEIPPDCDVEPAIFCPDPVPENISGFLRAEAEALRNLRPRIGLCLRVSTGELAQLVAADRSLESVKLQLRGRLSLDGINCAVRAGSHLELFVKEGQRKLFRYVVNSIWKGKAFQLRGIKVLANDPGFDVWHDTSTVYFESTGPRQPLRGVLRVSLETFLKVQMRTMEVTGTTDPARQSWALMAFYKYFTNELTEVYVERADDIRNALFELVTRIHV